MELRETFDRYDAHYATTDDNVARHSDVSKATNLPDCNQDRPIRAIFCLISAGWGRTETTIKLRKPASSKIAEAMSSKGPFTDLSKDQSSGIEKLSATVALSIESGHL